MSVMPLQLERDCEVHDIDVLTLPGMRLYRPELPQLAPLKTDA